MPQRRITARTANNVTSGKSEPSDATIEDNTSNDEPLAMEPLAQSEKNNLVPTIIVLSIVIGCVVIVSAGKKIT